MAELVLGLGASHGPSIQGEPERWNKLGERDTRDPRMNYNQLLANARPGLDKEIVLDVQRRRWAAGRAALQEQVRLFERAKVDAVIVVSNQHRRKINDNQPVFAILRSNSFGITKMSERLFDPTQKKLTAEAPDPNEVVAQKVGHPELATHMIERLIEDGFDVALREKLADGDALDDAFSFPYHWMFGATAVPMVPLFLSRDLPNQPTPARCCELGKALRRAVLRFDRADRVGVIASGGLSHQVIDEELDRLVIDALVGGKEEALRRLPRDRLNAAPGTPEILNWLVVGAAMAPANMRLLSYEPAYRSLAGTGHGLSFGVWQLGE